MEDDKDEDFEDIARFLVTRTEVCVRLYVLDGRDIEAKDLNSPSDPYIRLKLGRQTISDRKNYILDTYTP